VLIQEGRKAVYWLSDFFLSNDITLNVLETCDLPDLNLEVIVIKYNSSKKQILANFLLLIFKISVYIYIEIEVIQVLFVLRDV
jgi:hypothetical protein